MSNYSNYKYIIVGGGMTAASAVDGIRSVDERGKIALFTLEDNPPYDRPPLTKGLWTGSTELDEIMRELDENTAVLFQRIVRIDPAARTVTDADGEPYGYEKLLLATGGEPRTLDVNNEDIIYYRTLKDYTRLREATEQYDRFAVIGGSFIGSELAAGLAMNDKQVTMLFPEDGICANIFPADLAQYITNYYRGKGVDVHAGSKVKSITGGPGAFSLQTEGGTQLPADVVVAGIGIQPNVELAKAAGLEVDDGIRVNRSLQTSHADIYAAGDAANFPDAVLGTRRRVEHEDNANSMGEAAGKAMAGASVTYDYSPMFYSDMFDLGYEAVGELSSKLDVVADWQEQHDTGVIYYMNDGQVRGVLLWNVWEKTEDALELIASGRKFTADEVRGQIAFE